MTSDQIDKKRRRKQKRKFQRHKSMRAKMKELGVGSKIPQQIKTQRSKTIHKVRAKAKQDEWVCDWTKKHIMDVWGSKTRRELANDHEKHARDLLLKYNGNLYLIPHLVPQTSYLILSHEKTPASNILHHSFMTPCHHHITPSRHHHRLGPFEVYRDALLQGDFQQTHSGDPPRPVLLYTPLFITLLHHPYTLLTDINTTPQLRSSLTARL